MQVVFLLEVLCTNGKAIGMAYLHKRREEEEWSRLLFPAENPPPKDFRLWKEALYKLAPGGNIADRLGGLIWDGKKIWEWRYVVQENKLLYLHSQGMDVYERSTRQQYHNRLNRYEKTHSLATQDERGELSTIRESAPGIVSIVSHTPSAPAHTTPSAFWVVLEEWGCSWM